MPATTPAPVGPAGSGGHRRRWRPRLGVGVPGPQHRLRHRRRYHHPGHRSDRPCPLRLHPLAPSGPPGRPDRAGAEIAELTDLVDLAGWPPGTRLIVRSEPLHPGARQGLFDHHRSLSSASSTRSCAGSNASVLTGSLARAEPKVESPSADRSPRKDDQDIPDDVLKIVRWIDLERYDLDAPTAPAFTLKLRHINPAAGTPPDGGGHPHGPPPARAACGEERNTRPAGRPVERGSWAGCATWWRHTRPTHSVGPLVSRPGWAATSCRR